MINGVDRRGFLRTLGAAALASSAASTLRARGAEAQATSRGFAIREDRFGRMFRGLDPFFRENSSRLRATSWVTAARPRPLPSSPIPT